MKKKFLALILGFILTFSLVGCNKTLNVNVENSSELDSGTLGTQSFVEISSDLVYDQATRIVYIRNTTNGPCYCVYTAYYAPNGFPYRYNPENNTLEKIKFINE